MHVAQDRGRWYVELADFMEAVPSSLLDCVREVSCHDQFSILGRRRWGVYREGDAEAELDVTADQRAHQIKVRGKSRESVRSLYGKIRAGSVEPVEPWDALQARVLRATLHVEGKTIVDVLKEKGLVTGPDLFTAAIAARRGGQDLGDTLVELNYVTEENLWAARAELYGLVLVDLDGMKIPPEVIESVPAKVVQKQRIIPIQWQKRALVVAASRRLDQRTLDDLKFELNVHIEQVLASKSAMKRSIEEHYGIFNADPFDDDSDKALINRIIQDSDQGATEEPELETITPARLEDLDAVVLSLIPVRMAVHLRVIPISFEGMTLTIASAHRVNREQIQALEMLSRISVRNVLTTPDMLDWALRRYYDK